MPKIAGRRGLAKRLLDTIRRERTNLLRHARELENDGEEWAFDAYEDEDEPFLNELCLMLLVTLWHEVERELIGLAARVTPDGHTLTRDEYQERVASERKLFSTRAGEKIVIEKLGLQAFPAWASAMETLRLLANCYKHDPSLRPDAQLLGHLKLPTIPRRRPLMVDYAPLSESRYFREGLARSLELEKSADYCEIVEELLLRTAVFLHDVGQQDKVSEVRRGAVSSTRFEG